MTTPGCVKSTTTSHPVSASSSSPWSTSATTSRSLLSPTTRTTSRPIRPRAPSTPTLVIGSLRVALMIVCHHFPYRGCDDTRSCSSDSERAGVVEGADDGQGLWAGEDVGGDRADVVVGDGVD